MYIFEVEKEWSFRYSCVKLDLLLAGPPTSRAKEDNNSEEEKRRIERMVSSREDKRARLLAHPPYKASDKSDQWAKVWNKGDFLLWDIELPNSTFVEVLMDRKDLIRTYFKRGAPVEKSKN